MPSRFLQRLPFAVVIATVFLFLTPAAYATCSGSGTNQSCTAGATTLGSIGDSDNVGSLLAQKATLSTAGTLKTLSFYVTSGAAGSMHLAVYSDNSGQPGQLLAKTADFAVVNGWNTQPVTTQVALQPGTYWLAYEYTASSVQFLRFGSGTFSGINRAWAALPTSWGTSMLSGSDQWSFYATLGVSPPQSETLGASTLGTIGDSGNVGLLLAQKATLGTAGTLQTLSFYVTSGAGGSMHLAVYSDNSGQPGKLIAKTADFAVANGWNTQPVATQVTLQPGTYWLAYEYTDSSVQFLRFGNGTFSGMNRAWGALPATWGTPTLSGADHWSLYATLGVNSTPPVQSETLGANTLGTIGDSDNVGLLLAQKATLATAGTLKDLSFYVSSGAAGSMHLAVYSDNGGQPGSLIAKTADFAVVNGWNTQPVTTQVALQPGTYWLAYEYTDSSVQFLKFGNGTFSGINRAWGVLPAMWGTSTLSGSDQWSFYATLGMSGTTSPSPPPPPPPPAHTHYIRAGATGSPPCSDWTTANACNTLPATLVRGDTYYIAAGVYGAVTFDTGPQTGGATITIKKATAADHGTDTGWNATYGTGQATFTQWHFTTSDWLVDGAVRNENDWFDRGSYGFVVGTGGTQPNQIDLLNCPAVFNNIVIRYTAVRGYDDYASLPTGYDVGAYAIHSDSTGCTDQQYTGLVFDHMLVQGAVNQWAIRNTTGTIIEYSAAENAIGNGGNHGDAINAYYSVQNLIVRYNQFRHEYTTACGGCGSTGIIPICCGSNGAQVYGNWVSDFRSGDGFMGYSGGTTNNNKIYNNTIDTCNDGNGGLNLGGTGNVAYNNIWTNCRNIVFIGVTHDYDAFGDSDPEGESHAQVNLPTSIFMNYAAEDFRLASPTMPGIALPSPYNLDPLGTQRGSTGVWSRGAFEYLQK